MANNPGEVSHYCSMGTILLAEIISKASGMTLDAFGKKHLFTPLGIQNFDWSHTSKKHAPASAKRLSLTPRDLAKIGQLVMQKGTWNHKQIVSSQWIKEATTPKTKITGIDYGYLWWNFPFTFENTTYIAKLATGNGGQYIIVIPELDMIAVFTGKAYNSQEDKLPFVITQKVLIPTVLNKKI